MFRMTALTSLALAFLWAPGVPAAELAASAYCFVPTLSGKFVYVSAAFAIPDPEIYLAPQRREALHTPHIIYTLPWGEQFVQFVTHGDPSDMNEVGCKPFKTLAEAQQGLAEYVQFYGHNDTQKLVETGWKYAYTPQTNAASAGCE